MSNQNLQGINDLFDRVTEDQNLKNDAQLCVFLGVSPPVISKMRKGAEAVGASMILRLHERGGIPVAEIRKALES